MRLSCQINLVPPFGDFIEVKTAASDPTLEAHHQLLPICLYQIVSTDATDCEWDSIRVRSSEYSESIMLLL